MSTTIGVLIPNLTNYFATPLLKGLEEAAVLAGCSVAVSNTEDHGQRTRQSLLALLDKKVGAIVVVSEALKSQDARLIHETGLPVVLVATKSQDYSFASIMIDNRAAGRDAVRHLVAHGHRHIGLIAGPASDLLTALPRLEGWRDGLVEAGLAADDRQIAYGDFHFPSGREAMAQLRLTFPEASAVFAASDEMAMGALRYCREEGILVPDHLSVVGFDDTKIAEMGTPPLTSVRQPMYDMGRLAVEVLLQSGPRQDVVVPHSIVERASVARPRG